MFIIMKSITYFWKVAFMGYEDEIKLTRIAIKDSNADVALIALERIDDKVLLAEIAKYTQHEQVRAEATRRLSESD